MRVMRFVSYLNRMPEGQLKRSVNKLSKICRRGFWDQNRFRAVEVSEEPTQERKYGLGS